MTRSKSDIIVVLMDVVLSRTVIIEQFQDGTLDCFALRAYKAHSSCDKERRGLLIFEAHQQNWQDPDRQTTGRRFATRVFKIALKCKFYRPTLSAAETCY